MTTHDNGCVDTPDWSLPKPPPPPPEPHLIRGEN